MAGAVQPHDLLRVDLVTNSVSEAELRLNAVGDLGGPLRWLLRRAVTQQARACQSRSAGPFCHDRRASHWRSAELPRHTAKQVQVQPETTARRSATYTSRRTPSVRSHRQWLGSLFTSF